MDLIGDIVRDFVNRSRDELTVVEEGFTEWLAEPHDLSRLSSLAELLQSLQEMSGLLALSKLEDAFFSGHDLVSRMRQNGPVPCSDQVAQLRVLFRGYQQSLTELEQQSANDSAEQRVGGESTPIGVATVQAGGPPSPFRRSEALRGPANSLTDFIVENLANTEESEPAEPPPMGVRLVQLIDEVMNARHQIRQMFAHAASLPSEQERSVFLDEACASCPELRTSLERVLKSESQSRRLLEFPASELIRALLDSLRGELLAQSFQTPSVALTVPDDEVSVQAVESTVRVRPITARAALRDAASMSDSTLLPRPFGRYTLEQQLGQGAMGTVYLASDRLLNRQVALKLLRVKPEDGEETVERFYREARSMASLQHANLCPIYDFGEVDGQPFLTMAYINGRPLSEYLIGGRPLVTRYAVKLARTLATALHQAHQKGIIHRDLKPANVMINTEGEPILMDFGLARRDQPGEVEITQKGMILGSPAYMAPEQVEGRIDEIGPQTDVHALGVMLYEMLSGRKPFDGTVASVLVQIQTKDVEPLVIPGDTENRLDALCRRAMAKSISARYDSALEFGEALAEYLEYASQVRQLPDAANSPDRADNHGIRTHHTHDPGQAVVPRKRWWLKWAVASVFGGTSLATIPDGSQDSEPHVPSQIGSPGIPRTNHGR
jgi:serine/threonine protein kinase